MLRFLKIWGRLAVLQKDGVPKAGETFDMEAPEYDDDQR